MMNHNDIKHMLSAAKDHYNRGQFQMSENILEQIILADSSQSEVFHLLGCVYYKRGKIKKAIKSYRRALDIDPHHTDSTVGLSMVLNDVGRYDEARKVFEEGQKQAETTKRQEMNGFLEEQIANKHIDLGDLYFQAARYDEATEQYFEAYKFTQNKLEVRLKIVDCFLRKNEVARAVKELKLIIQEKPQMTKARIKLGMIYFKSNRVLEAVEQWESVLMRDPENPEAQKLLKMAQGQQSTILT